MSLVSNIAGIVRGDKPRQGRHYAFVKIWLVYYDKGV